MRQSFIPAVTAALAALLLFGCAVPDDKLSSLVVAPGKFALYNCPELAAKAKALAERQRELEGLMARAGEGAGGGLVNAVAYRPDYLAVRGEMRDVREAAAEKKCDLAGTDGVSVTGATAGQTRPR